MAGTRTILTRPAGVRAAVVAPTRKTSAASVEEARGLDRTDVLSLPPEVRAFEAAVGASRFAPSEVVADALQQTLARSRALVAQRELGVRHTSDQLGLDGHLYNKRVHGVPRGAKLVVIGEKSLLGPQDPADTLVYSGDAVFRHYTSENNLASIVNGGVLIPGSWPHSYGGGERWVDLIGAFLTTSRYKPGEVLPADHVHFVDVNLLPGTGLVDLSQGRRRNEYLMIPGVAQEREWYRKSYDAWVRAGRPSKEKILRQMKGHGLPPERISFYSNILSYVDGFERIFAQGGFPKPSHIPIRVIGTGKVQ